MKITDFFGREENGGPRKTSPKPIIVASIMTCLAVLLTASAVLNMTFGHRPLPIPVWNQWLADIGSAVVAGVWWCIVFSQKKNPPQDEISKPDEIWPPAPDSFTGRNA